MVTFKTYMYITGKFVDVYVKSCTTGSAKGFIVELIPVILYIEMPADVVEPKAPCTPAKFL